MPKDAKTARITKQTIIKTENIFQIKRNEEIHENTGVNDVKEEPEEVTKCVGGENIRIKFSNLEGKSRCQHCKEVFENPILLLRHKRKEHTSAKKYLLPEEIEKYYHHPNRNLCPICKKTLKTNNHRSVFIKHLQSHAVVQMFECIICKQKFKRKDHMLSHQKRHIVPIEDFIKTKNHKKVCTASDVS